MLKWGAVAESARDRQSDPVAEQFISFDGQQIRLRTNVPAVKAFIEDEYSLMLAESGQSIAGDCSVTRESSGMELRMGEEVRIWGMSQAEALGQVKHEIVSQFIRSRKNLLWLHAGAAERGGKALLLPGGAGYGKSTMVTELIGKGWRYLSDEIAPLGMESDVVIAYPVRPQRRRRVGRILPTAEVDRLPREIIDIPDSLVVPGWTEVGAIVFPRYETGVEAFLGRISVGEAAMNLLRNSLNSRDLKDLAVRRAAELAGRIPAYELCFENGAEASALLESLPLR